jgi:phosphoserine phosphatase
MVQIVLIRPGTSEFDEQGRIQGNLDIPLSEQGRREVQTCIDELKPLGLSAIYSSPSECAKQTADAIAAGLGIKSKQLDPLANLDHGLWQGMQLEEVKRKQPKVFRQWQEHPEMVCPPEGEMVCDCRERVEAAVAKLQKKHREGVIGIVVPEPLAGILHCVLTKCESAEEWMANPQGAAWEVVSNNRQVLASCKGEERADVTEMPAAVTNGTPAVQRIMAKNGANPGSISGRVSLKSGS